MTMNLAISYIWIAPSVCDSWYIIDFTGSPLSFAKCIMLGIYT